MDLERTLPQVHINANKKYAKIGKWHGFYFDANSNPRWTIGPDWPFFIVLQTVIFGISWLFTFYVAWESPKLQFWGWVVYGSLMLVYTATALQNPGLETRSFQYEPDLMSLVKQNRIWNLCEVVKQDKYTVHCEFCELCVQEQDHHCPWTGKCIGKGNIYFFYAWLVITLVAVCYTVLLVSLSIKVKPR